MIKVRCCLAAILIACGAIPAVAAERTSVALVVSASPRVAALFEKDLRSELGRLGDVDLAPEANADWLILVKAMPIKSGAGGEIGFSAAAISFLQRAVIGPGAAADGRLAPQSIVDVLRDQVLLVVGDEYVTDVAREVAMKFAAQIGRAPAVPGHAATTNVVHETPAAEGLVGVASISPMIPDESGPVARPAVAPARTPGSLRAAPPSQPTPPATEPPAVRAAPPVASMPASPAPVPRPALPAMTSAAPIDAAPASAPQAQIISTTAKTPNVAPQQVASAPATAIPAPLRGSVVNPPVDLPTSSVAVASDAPQPSALPPVEILLLNLRPGHK